MPHSVSSEPSEDVAMADIADDCSGKTQNDPAPTTADEVHESSDKENRNNLEDMFDDDSDDDDEFPSSAPSAHGDDNSQQERLVTSTRSMSSSALTIGIPAIQRLFRSIRIWK